MSTGHFFLMHPANLCLLIGPFKPFIFNVIIDKLGLKSASFCCCYFLFVTPVFIFTGFFFLSFCELIVHFYNSISIYMQWYEASISIHF